VLHLLFAITLDTLEKTLQSEGLLSPQLFRLSAQDILKLFLGDLHLNHFLLLNLKAHDFCLIVIFDSEINFLLLLLVHYRLRASNF
jgi:hypothetical protein